MRFSLSFLICVRSIVDPEVHPCIEAGHLVDVAVEQQGIASAELAEPPLPRLAPPRVFDLRVHVGIKAIPGVTSELEEVWAAG